MNTLLRAVSDWKGTVVKAAGIHEDKKIIVEIVQ